MLDRVLVKMSSLALLALAVCSAGFGQDEAKEPTDAKPSLNEERIAELTKLIAAQPKNPRNYRQRAFEYARGHKWDKAAEDYRQIAQLERGGSQLAQQIGVFVVLANDKKTHKQLCEEMVEVFAGRDNAGDLERTVKMGVLLPDPPGDLDQLLKLGQKGLELGKDKIFIGHHYRTVGLVLFRMKKYDEAIATIRKGDELNEKIKKPIKNVTASNRAIEAMCLVKLGKRDEAKKALAKAKPILDEKFKDLAELYQDEFWHDWLIAQALCDEATNLLDPKAKK